MLMAIPTQAVRSMSALLFIRTLVSILQIGSGGVHVLNLRGEHHISLHTFNIVSRDISEISDPAILPWTEAENSWSWIECSHPSMRHEIFHGGLRCTEETGQAMLKKLCGALSCTMLSSMSVVALFNVVQ